MTLALTGGTVVTSLDPPAILTADVVVDHGRIVAVGAAPAGATRRDCDGCLVVPGNVDTHTHLYSALARGMPFDLDAPRNFLQILQRVWWRLDRALDPVSIRASAQVAGLDALLCGTTTVVDHHASPNAIDGSLDLIADALAELGLRSLLCYEVSDRDGPRRAHAGVDENRRFLKDSGSRPLARGLVGAHASFTLSEDTLAACVEAAREAGTAIHIHAAEDAGDQRDAQARFGTRVIRRLGAAGAVTDGSLLAHCVHVDTDEVGIILDAGATVAHNARSNMNNGVGRAPVGALGESIALGSDGIGSDMFAESRAAFWRARESDVQEGPDPTLRRLAAGARFAGRAFDEPLGAIQQGAPADLAVLDYPAPAPVTADALAGHWFFGLGSRLVRDVMISGELVVADRRSTRIDAAEVAARGRAAAGRLWERIAAIGPHPFEPAGGSA